MFNPWPAREPEVVSSCSSRHCRHTHTHLHTHTHTHLHPHTLHTHTHTHTFRGVAARLFEAGDPRVEKLQQQFGDRAAHLIKEEHKCGNTMPVLVFAGVTANHGRAWLERQNRLVDTGDPPITLPDRLTIRTCTMDKKWTCKVVENAVHPSVRGTPSPECFFV